MEKAKLIELLMEAKKAYYTGSSIMPDSQFDELEEQLRSIDPTNKYFSIVGVNIKGSNQIKHNHPLLSCAKGKEPSDALDWLKRISYNGLLIGMAKVDGLTGCITYTDGKFSHMSTRGDGEIGQDISHLASYLNIPQEIPYGGVIDIVGEIYLPKDTKLETNGKPLRNIASGLVNRKDKTDDWKYLHFVSYNLLGNNTVYTFEDRLSRLKMFGFEVVQFRHLKKDQIEPFYRDYEARLRDSWNYETDGIVLQVDSLSELERIDSLYVVDHHHHYSLALKPKSETAITTLTGITWDVSKYGYCIPVANFEPVYLGDKEITNATLNNYEMVEKLDLHVGDVIKIANANEVIPFFVAKHSTGNGESLLISNCPCCGSDLIRNGVHMQCTNKECPDREIKVINDYCQKCEMDGVSQSTIETLWGELDIEKIEHLYNLHTKREQLLKLNGFGEKKVDNLLRQIEKSKTQTVIQFIARLGIENIGERAVKNLGITTLEQFWNFNDRTYVNGQSLIDFRNQYKEDILQLLQHLTIIEENKSSGGKTICMTGSDPWGKGRKQLTKELEDKGYTVVDSISKTTNILLCEDVNGTSSKLEKARKLGIELFSYEGFFK
jgi:DNA ligase (NAD+)